MAEAAVRDLHLSSQEVNQLEKAFKDPKFKELLNEYANEISQPSSRKEAESYLKFLEERTKRFSLDGKDLIIPTASFCCKTRNTHNGQKVFINVCYSERLEKPKSSAKTDKSGVHWEIPYSLGPMHNDKDKLGSDCQVYDYVIHNEAHELAKGDIRFKKFLVETAIEAVEKHCKLCLDRRSVKKASGLDNESANPLSTSMPSTVTLAHSDMQNDSQELFGASVSPTKDGNLSKQSHISASTGEHEVEPSYELVYQNDLDLKQFWEDRSNLDIGKNESTEVIVRVNLPNVTTIGQAQLDVSDKSLQLHIPGKYALQVALPLEVDPSRGKAKFDKSRNKLEITLPTCNKVQVVA
ncbi:hypothetical protein O6H91_12G065700 [Diphasiastrum complanatum]|uniref:Uncharacterized protein n=1 Tax=Diphasiastrum complanatum TaxID=34168 RepID=A0ACC2C2X4_DIPCM|nr:hypothetical protein O6H91_12G065700 [Diphasiastrum complanatum]